MDFKSALVCNESKPFTFISYSHKDAYKVYDIVIRLSNAGYNLWLDRGIEAGADWDESIANHITRSSYLIAFISGNYLSSRNCMDELNFARDNEKDVLLVYLDDSKLPPGLAMRMNGSQAVIWNEMDDLYSGEDFGKIISSNCMRQTLLTNNGIINDNGGDFIVYKCPNCGGSLPDFNGQESVECPFCSQRVGRRSQMVQPTMYQRPQPTPVTRTKSGNEYAKRAKIAIGIVVGMFVLPMIIGIIAFVAAATTGMEKRYKKYENDVKTYSSTVSKEKTEDEIINENAAPLQVTLVDSYLEATPDEYIGMYYSFVLAVTNPNEEAYVYSGSAALEAKSRVDGTVLDSGNYTFRTIGPNETTYLYGHLILSDVYDSDYLDPEITVSVSCDEFRKFKESQRIMPRTEEITFGSFSLERISDYAYTMNCEITNSSEYKLKRSIPFAVFIKNKGEVVYLDDEYFEGIDENCTVPYSTDFFWMGEDIVYDEVNIYPILH